MSYNLLDHDDYAEFERLFQAFVSRGGLDSTRCISEAYEIMNRNRLASTPTHCPHGLTRLTCSQCWLDDGRGGYFTGLR